MLLKKKKKKQKYKILKTTNYILSTDKNNNLHDIYKTFHFKLKKQVENKKWKNSVGYFMHEKDGIILIIDKVSSMSKSTFRKKRKYL